MWFKVINSTLAKSFSHDLPFYVTRVLGHFEKPIFLELCRFMETKVVPSGTYLFRIGEMDDSIYVVQSGKINVFITEPVSTISNS